MRIIQLIAWFFQHW